MQHPDQYLGQHLAKLPGQCGKRLPLATILSGNCISQMAGSTSCTQGPRPTMYSLHITACGGCTPLHLGLPAITTLLEMGRMAATEHQYSRCLHGDAATRTHFRCCTLSHTLAPGLAHTGEILVYPESCALLANLEEPECALPR